MLNTDLELNDCVFTIKLLDIPHSSVRLDTHTVQVLTTFGDLYVWLRIYVHVSPTWMKYMVWYRTRMTVR